MGNLFGTDGIRGEANVYPMDAATAMAVGQAAASHFKTNHTRPHLLIGCDTRQSADMLAHAAAAGICAAGVDAVLLGVLPTPGIACLTAATKAVAGIVISASHNPFSDNGIKIFDGRGYKLTDPTEERIEALLGDPNQVFSADPGSIGRISTIGDAAERYLQFLQNANSALSLHGLRVVLDGANGATHRVAPELFRRLGADTIALFCRPNGTNINHACGSQHPAQLAKAVVEHKADLGLAFDGDGDRLIAVDETGRILSGDQIMAVCAKHLLEKGAFRNKIVISTVMSNMGFHAAMKQMGLRLETSQVGDRYVMEKMLAEDAMLGGEDSGHIIFRDVHTTGDGMMAALRLVDSMTSAGQPLSQLSKVMTVYPQALISVDVKEKPDLNEVSEIENVIKEVEKAMEGRGRVLVRYSGTQNKCRIMVEGPTRELTDEFCQKIASVVKQAIGVWA